MHLYGVVGAICLLSVHRSIYAFPQPLTMSVIWYVDLSFSYSVCIFLISSTTDLFVTLTLTLWPPHPDDPYQTKRCFTNTAWFQKVIANAKNNNHSDDDDVDDDGGCDDDEDDGGDDDDVNFDDNDDDDDLKNLIYIATI